MIVSCLSRPEQERMLEFLEHWIAAPQSGKRHDPLRKGASPFCGLCGNYGEYSGQPYSFPVRLFVANGLDPYYPFSNAKCGPYFRTENMLKTPARRKWVKECIAALKEALA